MKLRLDYGRNGLTVELPDVELRVAPGLVEPHFMAGFSVKPR